MVGLNRLHKQIFVLSLCLSGLVMVLLHSINSVYASYSLFSQRLFIDIKPGSKDVFVYPHNSLTILASGLLTDTQVSLVTPTIAPLAKDYAAFLPMIFSPFRSPTKASSARYVRADWNNEGIHVIDGTSRRVKLAYARGYYAHMGSPISLIILAFGRQVNKEARDWLTTWGVQLIPDKDIPNGDDLIKDTKWITSVAEAFLQGYNDNPDHLTTTIAIGTSNSNYNWDCDNHSAENALDPRWKEAGKQWRLMLERIVVPSPKITLASANDVESWIDVFDDGWTPCSKGMVAWLDGFETAGLSTIRENINFGSNAWSENSLQWSEDDFMDTFVIRKYPFVQGYPQIYCSVSQDWVKLFNTYQGSLVFFGVTSDNSGSEICGTGQRSLRWEDSWNQLNQALIFKGFLLPSVSSFYLSLEAGEKP